MLRGWWNYYGSFYPTEMLKLKNYLDLRLMGWVRRKFKSLRHNKSASAAWLSRICRQQPQLFCHWRFHGANDRIMGDV